LLPAQQNPQAFFLDGRMKSANDSHAFVAERSSAIVGAEDGIARATDGAKQTRLAL
jgi:hypothetical protein